MNLASMKYKSEITNKGQKTGKSVVRRNRLGERLLADVLALQDIDVVETACKFEHILNEGVEEAICTILGHPSYCPHGKPIPKGACCSKNSKEADQIVGLRAHGNMLVATGVGT